MLDFGLYILSFFAAAVLTYLVMPALSQITTGAGFMAKPDERTAHSTSIPNLGGIAIYFGFMVALATSAAFISDSRIIMLLLGGLVVLFYLGIKDDILVLAPRTKAIVQFAVLLALIVLTDVRIESFSGLLGINELPYLMSVVFTLFVGMLVINAYNLIDGIDGLAGFIAIITTCFFGVYFYLAGQNDFILICTSLLGGIFAFLRFNLSTRRRIFMGDTGSMTIGFLLAMMIIRFIQLNQSGATPYTLPNAPVLAIAVYFFPLMDTLRVFMVRILNKKSPFVADRNHIHHRLIALGFIHWKASLFIAFVNLVIVAIAWNFRHLGIHSHLIIVLSTGIILCLTPFMIQRKSDLILLHKLVEDKKEEQVEEEELEEKH